MEDTTEIKINVVKNDKVIYMDIFAIFISIFGTVWCLSYGIFKLVNMEAFSAVFSILLGAVNGTFLIVNITSFIKKSFKNGKAY